MIVGLAMARQKRMPVAQLREKAKVHFTNPYFASGKYCERWKQP